jgi:hypothetical protein
MDKVCSMLSAVCDLKKSTAHTPGYDSKFKRHDAAWVRVVQQFLSSRGHKVEAADNIQVTDSDDHKAGSDHEAESDREGDRIISNAPSPEQECLPLRPVVTMQFNLFSQRPRVWMEKTSNMNSFATYRS